MSFTLELRFSGMPIDLTLENDDLAPGVKRALIAAERCDIDGSSVGYRRLVE